MDKYINNNSVYVKNGNQEQMILEYIKENGCITTLQAVRDLGILQAPARIWGLKRKGIKIATRKKEVIDRYGDTKRIVEYFIKEEGEKAV
jgi:hypothetical protein